MLIIILLLLQSIIYFQANAQSAEQVRPLWVSTNLCQSKIGEHCYIGTAGTGEGITDLESAKRQAYDSALIEAVRKEFPELITISEKTTESIKLNQNDYIRDTVISGEAVKFVGVQEEIGSPYIENKDGKWIVYRLLTWKVTNINAERKRQFELKNSQPKPNANINNRIPTNKKGLTGQLIITTIPDGASIYLEGSSIGQSNAQFNAVVEGSYNLTVQLPDYEIISKVISVIPGQNNIINLKLEKVKITRVINSSPQGASVYVDNVPINDKTPANLTKDKGDYSIKIELSDYKTESRTVHFDEEHGEKTENIDLVLLPGKLTILSQPSGFEVLIDGNKYGITPLSSVQLAGGEHKVRLVKDKFDDYETTVSIIASKPITILPKPVAVAEKNFVEIKSGMGSATKQKPLQTEESQTIKKSLKIYRIFGYSLLGLGLGCFNYNYLVNKPKANAAFDKYKSANSTKDAEDYRRKTEDIDTTISNFNTFSWLFTGVGAAFVVFNWEI